MGKHKPTRKQELEALQRYQAQLAHIKDSARPDVQHSAEQKQDRIKRAKKDFNFLVTHYFPHWAKSDCAPFHIKGAERVRRDPNIADIWEWARGLAKSTNVDVFIPIWLHLFWEEPMCMILVGKTEYAAKVLLSDLQAEFEANPQLLADFGELLDAGTWAKGDFRTKRGGRFFALGKGQSPRGKRNGPQRPNYIVLDDVDDDEECNNPKQVDKSVRWVLRALMPAMGADGGRFLMANNRIGNYTILTCLQENSEFGHFRVNALDKEGKPSWSYYTPDFYQRMQRRIGTDAFDSEYMNDPKKAGKIFKDEHMPWAPIKKRHQYERLVGQWDIAYSESATADCNAIALVGLTRSGQKHLLTGFCRQCVMEEALRWMYEYELTLPSTVIVEWYAESQFWNNSVELAMQTVAQEYGWRLPIVFDDRPQGNKYSRIVKMLPTMQRREFYVNEDEKHNPDIQRGLQQIKGIEPGYNTHDDFPDALQTAIDKLEESQLSSDSEPVLGDRIMSSKIF
jgi:phage terminase large subunit-like protein